MINKLILFCEDRAMNDLTIFEQRVRKAAETGFTHVGISAHIERDHWEIDDPADPWLQWNLSNSAFFKRVVPEGLKDFVPAEIAKQNMDILVNKSKILQKYDLKGVYSSWDPTWLPESFFKKHPDWRGPRVDHPRRSRHYRFAACIDHPEVLKLYRDTVCQIVKEAPSLDTFMIYSNDSGAGICWAEELYNNPNGPSACRGIGIGERIAGFLETIKNGAKDAGVEAEVTLCSQFSKTEADAILSQLKPGTGLLDWGDNVVDNEMERYKRTGTERANIPVLNIPQHYQLINGLKQVSDGSQIIVSLSVDNDDTFDDYIEMVKFSLNAPGFDIIERNKALEKLAFKNVGEIFAPKLIEVWELIDKAISLFAYPQWGGSLLQIATVCQRWLTRPLVPFPLELHEDEKNYYRKHQFQANSEEKAADMMNCQDSYLIDSTAGANLLNIIYNDAIGYLNHANSIIRIIIQGIKDEKKIKQLTLMEYSIKALICIVKNSIHVCHFQTMLYALKEPEGGVREAVFDLGGHTRKRIYDIYREEIDNTLELIGLLRQAPGKIIKLAPTVELEDTFNFSPDLAGQLQKKIDIMMAHWLDFNRLFARPNR